MHCDGTEWFWSPNSHPYLTSITGTVIYFRQVSTVKFLHYSTILYFTLCTYTHLFVFPIRHYLRAWENRLRILHALRFRKNHRIGNVSGAARCAHNIIYARLLSISYCTMCIILLLDRFFSPRNTLHVTATIRRSLCMFDSFPRSQ